ncbi:MAG: CDP-alcohol phosphatidyltransferase family protein [Gemmatimonadota bacterium]|nr:CDP-alcohol phosphatidyltransferase family protein [Gemmatimonadota bacterium]MDH3427488.1 CDP-alcohol phosphatidyltransferase family protein [Gemmatimonadota bacterium]
MKRGVDGRAPREGRHRRTGGFALARFEAWALPRLAGMLPARVMPDHMTGIGLVASTGVAVAYMLSNRSLAWLWVASGLLVVQWYGDSLDGTLARFRKIERPRYGFYLDHLTDAYSTLAIGLGLGFSPIMLLSVGLAISIAYLLLSVNVYLETHVFGEFKLGHGALGPTETRILLIGLNTLAVLLSPLPFTVFGVSFTVFDVVGLAAVGAMLFLLLGRASGNLQKLGRMEPPGVRKE